MNAIKKNKFFAYLLGVLQTFIGLTAIAGGFRLVSNPDGIPDFANGRGGGCDFQKDW